MNSAYIEMARREKTTVDLNKILDMTTKKSVQETEKILRDELKLGPPKKVTITLDQNMLAKMDRARQILGDHTTY